MIVLRIPARIPAYRLFNKAYWGIFRPARHALPYTDYWEFETLGM